MTVSNKISTIETWTTPSACVMTSHAAALRGKRGAVDLQVARVATPAFAEGPRTWSPPVT